MSNAALTLVMTTAGLSRFTAAQVEDDIDLTVATVGLTNAAFDVSPTLDALPGEFVRLSAISGQAIGDNVVHMIIQDATDAQYGFRGFGLFLADGTLFAVYGQAGAIGEKSSVSTLLFAIDIAFPTSAIDNLTFGNTNFLNPPATKDQKGVVELATEAEGLAGSDPRRVPSIAVTHAMIEARIPAGMIMLWYGASETVPIGWAICDGSIVDRADGAGEITTPDLRGRVAVGVSAAHAVGDMFGTVDATSSEAGAHLHSATATIEAAETGLTITTPTRNVDAGSSANGVVTSATLHDPTHRHDAVVVIEGADAHSHTVDVTQPSIALHYIMKI